jgi:hypothetical protein
MLASFLLWLANPIVVIVCLVLALFCYLTWRFLWEDQKRLSNQVPNKWFLITTKILSICTIAFSFFPLVNFFLAMAGR